MEIEDDSLKPKEALIPKVQGLWVSLNDEKVIAIEGRCLRTSKNISRIYELEEGETYPVMGTDEDTGE